MLALVFGCITFLFWLLMASSEAIALWRGGNVSLLDAADLAASTHLAGLQSRILWSAVRYNWSVGEEDSSNRSW